MKNEPRMNTDRHRFLTALICVHPPARPKLRSSEGGCSSAVNEYENSESAEQKEGLWFFLLKQGLAYKMSLKFKEGDPSPKK
ncbi:MAG: hypothetical protein DHS20C02_08090 [Micavibrio sp.]|nr:MAG: hypothetical protein DHS20C02_08090 [Micavibrio sp.]